MDRIDFVVGQRVLIYAGKFIYDGIVESVQLMSVTLSDAHIVYDTGEPGAKKWARVGVTPMQPWLVMRHSIESYGVYGGEEPSRCGEPKSRGR